MKVNEFVQALKEAVGPGFDIVSKQNQEALNLTVYAYGKKLSFNVVYGPTEEHTIDGSTVKACAKDIVREMNNARNFAGKCEGCNP